jgi:hypothetical protein
MNRVRSLTGSIVAALVLALGPGLALAGGSVHGHGKIVNGYDLSTSQYSIDAWLDDDGVAHGMMTFIGDITPGSLPRGGPADPWHLEVTDLYFEGNTAYVTAVIVHSLYPSDIGVIINLAFTDNRGTGEPDEIGGIPIDAGNITVND